MDIGDDHRRRSFVRHERRITQAKCDRARPGDADRFIEMIALSRLHGHSSGFFSVYSFPQIAIPGVAQAKINRDRAQTPDYRPLKPRILRKAMLQKSSGVR